MYYQAKYKKLKIVMKPARKKMSEDGEVVNIAAHYLKFRDWKYVPKDKAEEKFLDNYIEKSTVGLVWKLSDAELKLIDEQAKEMAKLQDKFKEEQSKMLNTIGKGNAGTGTKIVKGTVGTGAEDNIQNAIENENWKADLVLKANSATKDKDTAEKNLSDAEKKIAEMQEQIDGLTVKSNKKEKKQEKKEIEDKDENKDE